MKASEIRNRFLTFFESKGHHIVPSAPMVIKDDPTLMFTNAGMNQFKDIFLGNTPILHSRIANTQKCLRVSGKHNDLEEVGHDTYHHTMFEMLGNWSFGDYFKKEAIAWAWELLTTVYKLNAEDLYVTVFGGDETDGLPWDEEAYNYWNEIIDASKILKGSKKDNFWEMGDTGPCGPCSEIHIDLRNPEEKALIPGAQLINANHPLVIEIWNLVFIQFNRQASGKLVTLPSQHVDTGMGLERLCMAIQHKQSNYDTDVFQPIIHQIELNTGFRYGQKPEIDVAMRVIADHLRAVSFAIADGQLPSNNKAGYVIRRILRRAVRYGYSYLDQKEPFIHELVPVLVKEMGDYFQELKSQQQSITKVIHEEETSFIRTLATGINRFKHYVAEHEKSSIIDGVFAFELYDTYGFPIDLTQLMAKEKGMTVDMPQFEAELNKQKDRSRKDAEIDTGDWIIVNSGTETFFTGWDETSAKVALLRYRKVKSKGKDFYHVVTNKTPFYPESGGQVGDTGFFEQNKTKYQVLDTRKENNLIIHILQEFPDKPDFFFTALVDTEKRQLTANNHSATHLMHEALRKILGTHVEQKGSFVGPDYLRFDFSHFGKMTNDEIKQVEAFVNEKIRKNIIIDEKRSIPFSDAKKMGALMFFGDKYGENVRVITFGNSIELCGGTHVNATGQIGTFKIVSEGAIAAGIRRIEAVTSRKADEYIEKKLELLAQMTELVKTPADPLKGLKNIIEQNNILQKQIAEKNVLLAKAEKEKILAEVKKVGEIRYLAKITTLDSNAVKDLAFNLKETEKQLVILLGSVSDGKANLSLFISNDLVENTKLDASKIIRELAKEIQGGGGGQAFFATAGGKNPAGIEAAFEKMQEMLKQY
ncbi:MAG: alanine--tRNA ligase [Bacteroidales bacterium]